MSSNAEIPNLVDKLSDVIGNELAEQIVKVASAAAGNDAEAMIAEGLQALSSEQRQQTVDILDSYPT